MSVAERVGIRRGDEILRINGRPLRDVLDYQFYAAEDELELTVLREGEVLSIEAEREHGKDLGIKFGEPTFDGMRRCVNQCDFCFVNQMPRGLRSSLYVKDDDYRYSFLYGNYVTLTNLHDDDWARLAEQRLSPLYVSVHATDPTLRRSLLGNPSAPDILVQLRRLGESGIRVHAQIVLCPGLNDGDALEQSLADLTALWPTVQSVAIVPVGLTRYHSGGVRPVTKGRAEMLVERFDPGECGGIRAGGGASIVYLADEIYFLAGRPVPASSDYGGFPQLENGVGLTRVFLDEWEQVRQDAAQRDPVYGSIAIVSGTLFAPLLARVADELGRVWGIQITVHAVVNRLFGCQVTVSGLLGGQDVADAVRDKPRAELVVVPRAMLDSGGRLTLDGWDLERLAGSVGTTVKAGVGPADLVAAITGSSEDEDGPGEEGLACAG